MKNIKMQNLLEKLEEYNPDEIDIVKKAYNYADNLHTFFIYIAPAQN